MIMTNADSKAVGNGQSNLTTNASSTAFQLRNMMTVSKPMFLVTALVFTRGAICLSVESTKQETMQFSQSDTHGLVFFDFCYQILYGSLQGSSTAMPYVRQELGEICDFLSFHHNYY